MQGIVPTALFPLQPLAGTAAEDDPSTWTPDTHAGDLDEDPGSWLQPGLGLAVVEVSG